MGNLGQLSCTVMCVCTRTRVHMCLWLPSRARERGQELAQATVFVMVACGRNSSGQKTCWEPLCHPSRSAWVTSSHGNNSFLGQWFTKSLSDYERFQRCRSAARSTFILRRTFRIHKLETCLHAQHSGVKIHSIFVYTQKSTERASAALAWPWKKHERVCLCWNMDWLKCGLSSCNHLKWIKWIISHLKCGVNDFMSVQTVHQHCFPS